LGIANFSGVRWRFTAEILGNVDDLLASIDRSPFIVPLFEAPSMDISINSVAG
jgi:hypothetical protein